MIECSSVHPQLDSSHESGHLITYRLLVAAFRLVLYEPGAKHTQKRADESTRKVRGDPADVDVHETLSRKWY